MKYIIANLKSNKSRAEMDTWLNELKHVEGQTFSTIICPPMPSLMMVADFLADHSFNSTFLGVQDISPYSAGAYTGAVSGRNLEGFGVRYAIVGHSERRRYFHETNQDVANKVSQCLENSITPVVCVDSEYIQAQANAIKTEELSRCLVAYEPLAAIGSGENQPVTEVEPIVKQIRQIFGIQSVIYGGSVKPDNVADYLTMTDGVLVGTDSLDAKIFSQIISNAS
jgi:triosephosphate isomerase